MMTQIQKWQAFVDGLPISLGIRLALDSVSYTNPLPNWFEIVEIDHLRRVQAIRGRIIEYLQGLQPKSAFAVLVPKKPNRWKAWTVPTSNDQIILQTCVSSIAEEVYSQSVNKARVFSYRYNTDPNRLALIEDPIRSWNEFQNETHRRCDSDRCLLQFDIADAFASISRPRFVEFLRRRAREPLVVDLLSKLVFGFSPELKGLPLINDSLFFLGNAYLSEIDAVLERHTSNFIRFVDDYRVFGSSRDDLSNLLNDLGQELSKLGYQINADKIRLGTGQEYLEAVSTLRYAVPTGLSKTTSDGSLYISATIFADIIPPGEMVTLIHRSVQNPAEYLNEGLGRLQLAALKKLRINASIAEERNYSKSPYDDFIEELSRNSDVVRDVIKLLRIYPSAGEVWRSVWLLYLSQDIRLSDTPERGDLTKTLQEIQVATDVPEVIRLWAHAPFGKVDEEMFERLQGCDYVECGRMLAAKS